MNSLPVQASVPVQHTTAIPFPSQAPILVQQTSNSIPLPPLQSTMPEPSQISPTVRQINEIQDYRSMAWCGCAVGKCTSGNCRCHKAKRACGPLCHGGKVNINCKATLNRIYS